MVYKVMSFPSSEHLYQYRKVVEHSNFHLAEHIRHVEAASEAKKLSKFIKSSQNWFRIKLQIMFEITDLKYHQCLKFRNYLLGTGDRELIHTVSDDYWGQGRNGKGWNTHGKVLKLCRKGLITSSKASPVSQSVSKSVVSSKSKSSPSEQIVSIPESVGSEPSDQNVSISDSVSAVSSLNSDSSDQSVSNESVSSHSGSSRRSRPSQRCAPSSSIQRGRSHSPPAPSLMISKLSSGRSKSLDHYKNLDRQIGGGISPFFTDKLISLDNNMVKNILQNSTEDKISTLPPVKPTFNTISFREMDN